ncbi:MAG: peptide deformylase [Actinobacteria bacterium]|nr:MAG: peptide deformylase [Actinomycetota bacterium]
MAVLTVRKYGDPVLRRRATPVGEITPEIRRMVRDMVETMYDAPGVGLAAPQIGISKRVFVADAGDGPFAMVNPTIVATDGKWKYEEGCLSVPGRYWSVTRALFVRAEGLDLEGNPVAYEGDELMGRILQHEIDHLEGVLILDRLPKRTRKAALKEIREESLDVHRFA